MVNVKVYNWLKRHLLFLFNNVSEYFDSFVRLTEKKLYNYMKLPNKSCQRTKKSQLTYYQMVLYIIKNLSPIKDILRTLPSSGINNYIKI